MATALIVQSGMTYIEGLILADMPNWSIGLSTYSTAPALFDTLSSYTGVEASFTGYAEVVLSGTPTSPTIDGNNNAQSDYPTVTFTCSGTGSPQTINSFFVYQGTGGTGTLLFASLLDAPVTITNSGDFVSISMSAFQGNLLPPF